MIYFYTTANATNHKTEECAKLVIGKPIISTNIKLVFTYTFDTNQCARSHEMALLEQLHAISAMTHLSLSQIGHRFSFTIDAQDRLVCNAAKSMFEWCLSHSSHFKECKPIIVTCFGHIPYVRDYISTYIKSINAQSINIVMYPLEGCIKSTLSPWYKTHEANKNKMIDSTFDPMLHTHMNHKPIGNVSPLKFQDADDVSESINNISHNSLTQSDTCLSSGNRSPVVLIQYNNDNSDTSNDIKPPSIFEMMNNDNLNNNHQSISSTSIDKSQDAHDTDDVSENTNNIDHGALTHSNNAEYMQINTFTHQTDKYSYPASFIDMCLYIIHFCRHIYTIIFPISLFHELPRI